MKTQYIPHGCDQQGRLGSAMNGAPEEWKDIPGYEGHYSVSSWGRIYSHRRMKMGSRGIQAYGGKQVSQRRDLKGYMKATLCKDDIKTTHFVHHLVLLSFVGQRPEGMHCCHNDGTRDNNEVSNLRWDTPAENEKDKVRHGTKLFGQSHGMAKITEKQAVEIKKDGRTNAAIAKLFGLCRQTIGDIKAGKRWSHLQRKDEV